MPAHLTPRDIELRPEWAALTGLDVDAVAEFLTVHWAAELFAALDTTLTS